MGFEMAIRTIKSEKDKQGQSTLEYLVILAVVIGVIVYVATAIVKPSLVASMNKLGNAINYAADEF